MTLCAQRGVSHEPGNLTQRVKTVKPTPAKPFDVKEWHRRKAAEARERQQQARQIEKCYQRYVPPQIQHAPELTEREESTERLMRSNRAVGL